MSDNPKDLKFVLSP